MRRESPKDSLVSPNCSQFAAPGEDTEVRSVDALLMVAVGADAGGVVPETSIAVSLRGKDGVVGINLKNSQIVVPSVGAVTTIRKIHFSRRLIKQTIKKYLVGGRHP